MEVYCNFSCFVIVNSEVGVFSLLPLRSVSLLPAMATLLMCHLIGFPVGVAAWRAEGGWRRRVFVVVCVVCVGVCVCVLVWVCVCVCVCVMLADCLRLHC